MEAKRNKVDNPPYPEQPILDYEPIEPGRHRGSGKRKGCSGCLVFLAVVCALIGGSVYYAYTRILDTILEDTPLAWPSLNLSPAEIDEADQKLKKVIAIGEGGGSYGVLSFSDRELNALCSHFEGFKDRVFCTLIEDEIKVEFSVPYRDRFLNGRLQGVIKAEEGTVRVTLRSLQVGTYVFSPGVREQTAAFFEEELSRSPEVQQYLKTIHTVEIRDGLIFVRQKTENGQNEENPLLSSFIPLSANACPSPAPR